MKKNIININGKPLLAWSIEQAMNSQVIQEVYVSSDDDEILACATKWGAVPLLRSGRLSTDDATSEEGWLDVLEKLREEHKGKENSLLFKQLAQFVIPLILRQHIIFLKSRD